MQINGSSALCRVIGFSPDSPLLCKKRFQGFIHTSPDITEVNNQTCTVCFNYEGEFFPIVIACKESYPIWCIFVTAAFTLTLIVQWCWMSQTIKHILLERPGISVCWFYGSRTLNGPSDQAMCLMFPIWSTESGFSFTSNIVLVPIWLYQIWINPLQGVPDRASKKLFTKDILLPGSGKFPEPSQKIVSATASRYFIFWASSMIQDLVRQCGNQTTQYMLHQSWNIFFVKCAQNHSYNYLFKIWRGWCHT